MASGTTESWKASNSSFLQDCPAYRGAMKEIRKGKICTLAAMCEALAEQPLQNEPGGIGLWNFCSAQLAASVAESAKWSLVQKLSGFVARLIQVLATPTAFVRTFWDEYARRSAENRWRFS